MENKYIKKISKNLKKLDITFEEFQNDFRRAGGYNPNDERKDAILKREWEQTFKNKERPTHVNHCLCNHYIEDNRYIKHFKNNDTILILGSCCIKRFMKYCSKMCEICDKPHKNRKDNKCNKCRNKAICPDCNEIYKLNYYKDNLKCNNCENKIETYSKNKMEPMVIQKNFDESKRIYLKVKFEQKDDAKKLGAFWDAEKKQWYARNNMLKELIEKYS